jgi:hypothetical protein
MDLLTDLGIDPHLFVAVLVVGIILTTCLYSRFVINIFDQLLMFMLSTVACSTLVFGLPWDPSLKVEYVCFALSFWLGFAIRGKINRNAAPASMDRASISTLELTLIMLFVLLELGNALVGLSSGFPMFSSVPDAAKVTMYQGGFGIVRRFNLMPFVFFSSGCTLLAVLNYRRRLFLSLLFLASLMIMLTGAKSALLPVVVAVGLVVAHKGVMGRSIGLKTILSMYGVLIYGTAAGLAVLILVIDSGSGLSGGLQLLMKRLLFNGDVILYYFPTRGVNPKLLGLNWFNYLEYLFKGWLATVRITSEYPPALGSVIMGTDEVGFGPNPLYFVRADIFFGPVAGCAYSALIGYGVAWLRRLFFTGRSLSVASLALRLTFAGAAFELAIDSAGFIGGALDLLILVGPLWVVAKLILHAAHLRRRSLMILPRAETA